MCNCSSIIASRDSAERNSNQKLLELRVKSVFGKAVRPQKSFGAATQLQQSNNWLVQDAR